MGQGCIKGKGEGKGSVCAAVIGGGRRGRGGGGIRGDRSRDM